jgi:putative transposase
MNRSSMMTAVMPRAPVGKAWEEVSASFDRFCLAAGIETLGAMMEKDAEAACGPRHSRGEDRRGHRWGRTQGKIGFHGGKVAIERPRVRELDGKELPLESWQQAVGEDWLGRWAMNLMLINVSTRKFRRAVRLPEGDLSAPAGSHMTGELVLVAAIGIDGDGVKHPLGLIEGATENSAVVQVLIDNLVARGLDPAVPRLFIIDGSKALSKAIRRSFGREALIQRCQIHKARNIMERLPKPLHATVRRVLRQAWELKDAGKAEKLIRNLARRLEHDAPGVSASILEGLDEILTVTQLGLPKELRRALACTNIVENVMSTARRVCRNVKRWRSAAMALRWTAAAMQEAAKGFRRLKAHKQLPALRAALEAHRTRTSTHGVLARQANAT